MKSVLQNYSSGELKVIDSPTPQLRDGSVLVRTACSVISAGTEKTKVDMGSKSLLGKARSRPDLVRQVFAKAKREGLWKTWQTVQERLATPASLGYCLAGEVIEVAGDVNGLRSGDLVACGGSTANHAEIVCVPKNLVVPVPATVHLDHAAFAILGAIAMQGVRQADVRVGEKVAVIGLGLIGLLTVQILKAAGCRVFGIDIATDKTTLGRKLGCARTALANDDSLEEQILAFTDGYGVDATIITAASSSNQPVEHAAEITREKGRVVVVGLTKMELPREPFYLKELDLRLSRSYGPGRYDTRYEDEGLDYPYAYVRFTERRNMVSFLELVETRQVQLDPLISHRFPIDEAVKAYSLLQGVEPYLGILLEYDRKTEEIPRRIELRSRPVEKDKIVLAVIGAGKYAAANLLPFLRAHPAITLGSVCTGSGVTAAHVAERLDFAAADADVDAVIRESDAVLIATRHNEHAHLVIKALQLGKPVFVEKPLAITEEQLAQVIACFQPSAPSGGDRDGEGMARGAALQGSEFDVRSSMSDVPSQSPSTAAVAHPVREGQRVRDSGDGSSPSRLPSGVTSPSSVVSAPNSDLRPPASDLRSLISDLRPLASLTVGFNRRFAPATTMVKKHFESVKGPKQICLRINAGAIPPDHWIHDPQIGGGRLVGEGCHFVDLAVALAGAVVRTVSASAIPKSGSSPALWDNFVVTMEMEDDSVATIVYTSIGDTGLAKERIEIYGGGRSAVIDDFRAVELWAKGRRSRKSWWSQDKGQREQIATWIKGLQEGTSPIPVHEIFNVHAACFAAMRCIESGSVITI